VAGEERKLLKEKGLWRAMPVFANLRLAGFPIGRDSDVESWIANWFKDQKDLKDPKDGALSFVLPVLAVL